MTQAGPLPAVAGQRPGGGRSPPRDDPVLRGTGRHISRHLNAPDGGSRA